MKKKTCSDRSLLVLAIHEEEVPHVWLYTGSRLNIPVLWIRSRIRRIRMYLDLPDPTPSLFVRIRIRIHPSSGSLTFFGPDPDPRVRTIALGSGFCSKMLRIYKTAMSLSFFFQWRGWCRGQMEQKNGGTTFGSQRRIVWIGKKWNASLRHKNRHRLMFDKKNKTGWWSKGVDRNDL